MVQELVAVPLSAMGVDRDAVVRTELLASRAARGLTGLFWWGFVLGSGSVVVGPLGVRRDAALMPFWRSFVLQSEPVGAAVELFCERS